MSASDEQLVWHRVAEIDALEDGRVRTVQAGHRSIALTRIRGRYGALDNRCPHHRGATRGGLDRGGAPAMPVARVRLRPPDGHAPAPLQRRSILFSRRRA